MKLAVFVLLSMAALTWADSSYTQYQQNTYPNYYAESAPSSSNYYGSAPTQRRQGIVDSIRDFFFSSNRRQAGIAGGLPIIAIAAVVLVVVVVAVVVAVAAGDFSSSGRGLDTNQWEVDHSVWMNQLQKDFEDSWSTE